MTNIPTTFAELYMEEFVPAWSLVMDIPPPSLALFQRFYGEENRSYHGMSHIVAMSLSNRYLQQQLRKHDTQIDNLAAAKIIIAIWFHDLIYDAKRKDNEATSALLYEAIAGLVLVDLSIKNAIVLTVHQELREESSRWIQYFLDLDLYGLGEPLEIYQKNGANIRKEYSHVSDLDWAAGRRDWITKMLSRKKVFYNPFGLPELDTREEVSRKNMTYEYSLLTIDPS